MLIGVVLFLAARAAASPFAGSSLIVLRAGDVAAPPQPGTAALVALVEIDAATGAEVQALSLNGVATALTAALTLSTDASDESTSLEGDISVDAAGCEVALLGYNVTVGGGLRGNAKVMSIAVVAADGAPRIAGTWHFVGAGYSRADGAVPAPGGRGVFAVAGQSAGCAVAFLDTAAAAAEAVEVFPNGGASFAARGVAIAGAGAPRDYELFVGSGGIARRIGSGLPTAPGARSANVWADADMGAGFIFSPDVATVWVAARNSSGAGAAPHAVHRHDCAPAAACPRAGTWTRNASVDLPCTDAAGIVHDLWFLDADFSAGDNAPVFYATTVRGDALVRLDAATGACAVLARAPTNTVFRGVALAPRAGNDACGPTSATPSPLPPPLPPSMSPSPSPSPSGASANASPPAAASASAAAPAASAGGAAPAALSAGAGAAIGVAAAAAAAGAALAARGGALARVADIVKGARREWQRRGGGAAAERVPLRPAADASAARVGMLQHHAASGA